MNAGAAIATIISGGVVFVVALLTLARAIFQQANATKENTVAVRRLGDKIEALDTRVDGLEVWRAVQIDRQAREP